MHSFRQTTSGCHRLLSSSFLGPSPPVRLLLVGRSIGLFVYPIRPNQTTLNLLSQSLFQSLSKQERLLFQVAQKAELEKTSGKFARPNEKRIVWRCHLATPDLHGCLVEGFSGAFGFMRQSLKNLIIWRPKTPFPDAPLEALFLRILEDSEGFLKMPKFDTSLPQNLAAT